MKRRRRTTAARRLGPVVRPGNLWRAIWAFRASMDLKDLGIDDAYRDVRDRSPGRRVRM
jgi:hypothetical protein